MIMTEQELLQSKTDYLREQLDYLQAQVDMLDPFIRKDHIRRHISLWRECITVMKKHYPKAPELYAEMIRFDIKKIVSLIIMLPAGHLDIQDMVQRLRNLLEFPQRFHDNYDDMFPPTDKMGNRMLSESQFFDLKLQEAHEANNYQRGDMSDLQAEVDRGSKVFKNQYKKYVKEWTEKWQSR